MQALKQKQMEMGTTLRLFLRFAGYEVASAANTSAHALATDSAMAARMKCGHCRRRGMELHPFRRGNSYRCVVECPVCGHGEEY